MVLGAIYYNDKLFGAALRRINKVSDPDGKKGHSPIVYIVAYLFCVLIGFTLSGMVNHQTAAFQMMIPEVMESGSAAQQQFIDLMKDFGTSHRNFKHGALHGGLAAIMFAFPLIGVIALFENRGWKYILIHTGYWLISLVLMGGLLCQMLVYPSVS